MGKQKRPINYIEVLRKLARAGIAGGGPVNRIASKDDTLPTLRERVDSILGIINHPQRPANNMLFFVMYDIENNKVRYNVVKYLQRQGCTRIQKSIFLADLPSEKCDTIKRDLAEVQALYDNHDSIIVCPISTDLLRSMKVIGHSIDIDIIMHTRNTLFF